MAKEEKKAGTTALAKNDERLRKLAEKAAKQEAQTGGGGKFFSTKGGILKFDKEKVPGNRTAVVILDATTVHALYEGDFDEENPQSPVCWSVGETADVMRPNKESTDPYGKKTYEGEGAEDCPPETTCGDCPLNQFGTARKGNGKACKNTRRLAVLPAGKLALNAENPELDKFEPLKGAKPFKTNEIAFVSVPPGSLVGYKKFAEKTISAFGAVQAVYAKMSLVPDEKRQHVLKFEVIDQIEDAEALEAILERAETEAPRALDFGFIKREDGDAGEQKADAKPKKKRKY